MATYFYIQTSDPTKNIEVSPRATKIVNALPVTRFNLTNTLRGEAMRDARECARIAGLKLHNVKAVAAAQSY